MMDVQTGLDDSDLFRGLEAARFNAGGRLWLVRIGGTLLSKNEMLEVQSAIQRRIIKN
jgi:hypothetical protein